MTTPTIDTLARKDPLAFGISYIDLLENRQWTLEEPQMVSRALWHAQPLQDREKSDRRTPPMAITKSTQAGISTMAIVKALHFMSYWDVRIGYMLPRSERH